MENYQRGKIYAIICRKTGRRYIGSTCEPTLAKRLAQHVRDFKMWKRNISRFTSSYDIIKDGNYYIVLLELYPCGSKDELRMCEQKHIDLNECVNKRKAFITEEEKLNHNEERREYYKKYKEDNKEKIKQKYDCPCGSTLRKGDKSTHERTQKHLIYLSTLNATTHAMDACLAT